MIQLRGLESFWLAVAIVVAATSVTRADDQPYEINAVLPLTGAVAFLGKGEQAALEVVQDLVNKRGGIRGRPIRFVVLDDQSSPQLAVQLTNGLIAKGVPAIIGSTLAAICNAQAPLVKDGPVLFCLSPVITPPAGSYVFTSGQTTDDLISATLRFLQSRGWRKIALITANDATGQDFDARIDRIMGLPENRSASLVAHEHFNLADISVAAQMAHVKSSGANVLIAWTTGTQEGTLLRGAVDAGIDLPVLISPAHLTYADMKAYAAFLPKEVYFPGTAAFAPDSLPNGPIKRAVADYLAAFRSHGIEPDQGYLFTWNPALLIVDALNKYGLGATPAQIREFIGSYRGAGALGQYDFQGIPQRGLNGSSVIIVRWDPAKGTWVGASRFGGEPLRR